MLEYNFLVALPEIVFACGAMALLVFGVFQGDRSTRLVGYLTIALFAVVGALVVWGGEADAGAGVYGLHGLFVVDFFAVFVKILVLLASSLTVFMSASFIERENMNRFEFPVLMAFATLGMLMMVSANDLMSLYVGIELQSLSAYVLAAFRRDTVRSSEAGLKYFVLGALSSGLLLFGISLVYGFAGTTNFVALATQFQPGMERDVGVIVGVVFLSAALAFKMSAAPFHMWTPDVYEGAPTPVTAFFAVAPKIAAIALFVRVLVEPFGGLVDEWRQIVAFIAILSMFLGGLAAIGQTNIKRLMAYSSIGHVGYALVGLAAGNVVGVTSVLVYLSIYLFMNVGAFAVILGMRQNGRHVETIQSLAGLSRTQPLMAAALAVFMFSMAGIPPLAGFFAKWYVFEAAVRADLYALAIIGVLTSVISAYYYLRIVKVMYFDEPVEAFDRPLGGDLALVMTVGALVTLFGILPVVINPIYSWSALAAASLAP